MPLKMLPTSRSSVGALDGEFLEPAFLGDGDARFECFGVNDDFLVDAFDGFDQPLDSLDEVVGRGAEGFHNSLGLLLDGDGREGCFLLDAFGGLEVRFAEPGPIHRLGRWFGQPLRRQAGGDILRPVNLVVVPAFIDLFRGRGSAHGLGRGVDGFAVGRLRLPMTYAATGAEPHAAPASREVSVTHI